MKRILSLLGTASLIATTTSVTANVVSCSNKFKLPIQPKTIEEALYAVIKHLNNAAFLLSEIESKIPNFNDIDETNKWLRENTKFQEFCFESVLSTAYLIKVVWFQTPENVEEELAVFAEKIKNLKNDRISSDTFKDLEKIYEWTKINPITGEAAF